jgi:hypothetical protein
MTLEEFCLNIGKSINLPQDYHIAAIFEDNEHDEIIGWRVLDKDNNQITNILQAEELYNWRNLICE